MQWIKLRNCDIVDDKQRIKADSSPSLRRVHCHKVEILAIAQMLRAKLWSLVLRLSGRKIV